VTSLHRLVLIGAAIILAHPSAGEAKVILITYGDTINRLGEISVQGRPKDIPANLQLTVGFKYHYGGVFWLDFITSDGTFCVYEGDRYFPITKAEAAQMLGKPESELSEPFWYRFPPGWIVAAAIILIGVVAGVHNHRKKKQVEQLLMDARYQRATEIFVEAAHARHEAQKKAEETKELPAPTREPWDEAIAYLVGIGIDKTEAELNFGKVLGVAPAQASPPTD
jgi:hypothetical protein